MTTVPAGWTKYRASLDHYFAARRLAPPSTVRRDHYREVANELEATYGNVDLALAGYLHWLPQSALENEAQDVLSTSVADILRWYQKIVSLNSEDPDVSRFFLSEFLPRLADPRPILLAIHDHIAHTDPSGEFRRWSEQALEDPHPWTGQLPAQPFTNTNNLRRNPIAFGRSVLAPACKSLGLFMLRRVLDDLALHYEDKPAFDAYTALISDSRYRDLTRSLSTRVCDALAGSPRCDVAWNCYHLAKIRERLSSVYDAAPVLRTVLRTGYLQIECENGCECYRTIGRLHSMFMYQDADKWDYIGTPASSGYRSLHASLLIDAEDRRQKLPIRAHIVPRRQEILQQRREPAALLAAVGEHFRGARSTGLCVFTPEGMGIEMPAGSVVLNFAHRIHSGLVTRVTGATINRQPVGVLHRLNPNDVVWLDINQDPQPLPEGWQASVPAESVADIRQSFRRCYRHTLRESGREWIQLEMKKRGVDTSQFESTALNASLETALIQMFGERRDNPNIAAEWWLQQFGIVAHAERSQSIPFDLKITRSQADRAMDILATMTSKRPVYHIGELDLPADVRNRVISILMCPHCDPPRTGQVVATVRGDCLWLHRVGHPCAENGFEVSWRQREVSNHFFLLEITNRIGVGEQVLSVFRLHRVDIIEFVGRRLDAHCGAARIMVDHLGPDKARKIALDLSQIDGVTRVIPPGRASIPALEDPLPPRLGGKSEYLVSIVPYVLNEPVRDQRYFYGMQPQLDELLKHEAETRDSDDPRGKSVFLAGPLRTGKSSLALAFASRLRSRGAPTPPLVVYLQAWRGEDFVAYSRRLADKMRGEASRITESECLPYRPIATADVVDTVLDVQRTLNRNVVLLIDEGVGLLANAKTDTAKSAVLSFLSRVDTVAGLLAVWIGPRDAKICLDSEIRSVLLCMPEVRIGRLDVLETQALLGAEKCGSRHEIVVKRHIAARVASLTNGNPFWIAHIGERLWRAADRSRRLRHRYPRRIFYTREMLKPIVGSLIQSQDLFETLYTAVASGDRDLRWKILITLVSNLGTDVDGDASMSTAAIDQQLTADGYEGSLELIADYLALMAEQGSITTDQDGRWRVAAKLLTLYVKARIQPS